MRTFKKKVLDSVRKIPKGKVASYGQIALMAGIPRAARQVGYILSRVTPPDEVPWWRVINNSGRISIKNPEYAPQMQKKLLEKENIVVSKIFEVDIEKYRWQA